jgi:hypothetical protein
MQLARLDVILHHTKMTWAMISLIFSTAKTAIDLHFRLIANHFPDLEPLFCFLGFSNEILNDSELGTTSYPLQFVEFPNSSVSQFVKYIQLNSSFESICIVALQIRLFQLGVPLKSPFFEFIESFECAFRFPSQSALSIYAAETFQALPFDQLSFQLLAGLYGRAIYEFEWNPIPIASGEDIKLSPESQTDAERIPKYSIPPDFKMNESKFTVCCLLSLFEINQEVFANLPEDAVCRNIFVYALYLNANGRFLAIFAKIELPSKFQTEATRFSEIFDLNISLPDLIAKGDNREAAQQLLLIPDCLSLLNPEFRFHKLVAALLTTEPDFPADLGEVFAANLFRSLRLSRPPSKQFIIETLQKILTFIGGSDRSLDYADIPNSEAKVFSINLPVDDRDFLNIEPLTQFVTFSWITALCAIATDPENETEYEIFADLSLFAGMNWSNERRLSQFLESNFGGLFVRVRDRLKHERVVAAVANAADRPAVIASIASHVMGDYDLIELILKFLMKENDESAINATFSGFADQIPLVASRFSTTEQVSLFQRILAIDSPSLASSFCVSLDQALVFGLLAENARNFPGIVLAALDKLQISSQNAKLFIEKLPTFSDEISSGFVSILRRVLSVFPSIPCNRGIDHNRPTISVSWEPIAPSISVKTVSNPWEILNEYGPCKKDERDGFWCITCRILGQRQICLRCADICHRGHTIVRAVGANPGCACGRRCRTPTQPIGIKPKPIETVVTPNLPAVISLFQSITSSKIAADAPFHSRYNNN